MHLVSNTQGDPFLKKAPWALNTVPALLAICYLPNTPTTPVLKPFWLKAFVTANVSSLWVWSCCTFLQYLILSVPYPMTSPPSGPFPALLATTPSCSKWGVLPDSFLPLLPSWTVRTFLWFQPSPLSTLMTPRCLSLVLNFPFNSKIVYYASMSRFTILYNG
jgi:hypothetical protein